MVSIDDLEVGGIIEAEPQQGLREIRRILDVTRLWGKGTIKYEVIDFKERSQLYWASDPEDEKTLPLNTPEVPINEFLREAIEVIPMHTNPAVFEEGVRYRAVSTGDFFDVWEITDLGVYVGDPESECPDYWPFWRICRRVIERDDFLND